MERIVYYKTASPYPNDFTKFCSLNGIEIDNNFLTLEGRDIKSISTEGNYIVVTLYNGTKLKTSVSSIYGGYQAGKGIDEVKFNEQKIIETNAELSEITRGIVVQGASVGSYKPGDNILEGTSVEEILRNILIKVYDVEPVLPVSNIDVFVLDNPLRQTYELGTVLNTVKIRVDGLESRLGYFVGEEGWSSQTEPPIPQVQIAGCNSIRTHYLLNHAEIGVRPELDPLTNYVLNANNEGIYTFGTKIDYDNSSLPAVRSDGSHSEVLIPAGTTAESTKSFTAAYKYYYGYIESIPTGLYCDIVPNQATLQSLDLQTGFCKVNGTVVIDKMESSDEKPSLLLALPAKYKNITYTENVLHEPINIDERWIQQKHYNEETGEYEDLTITYIVGDVVTKYYIYILHSLIPVRYNKITFGGA